MKRFVWIAIVLLLPMAAKAVEADSTEVVRIGRILILGNRVTQERIILREMSLKPGDTIRRFQLKKVLEQDRIRIYNLRLFNRIYLQPADLEPGQTDILVELEERWYTFPVPIFELSDRNFNEWWENYKHDFSRVNYGLRLFQYNFRGRNETLRLTARFGFSRRFDLYYRIPNLSRNQKHGLLFEMAYAEPVNLAYRTKDHILDFLNDRKPLRKTTGVSVTYSFRKSFYQTHSVEFTYDQSSVADTIKILNPEYFSKGVSQQWYNRITYRFVSEHRDVVAYPLHGYQVTAGVSRVGLGLGDKVNQWTVAATYAHHLEVGKDLYFSWYNAASLTAPADQPYAMVNGIGYRKQFLRGYEIYVIEGPFFSMNKATLKKRIFHRELTAAGFLAPQFSHVPFSIYLKTYADVGYASNYPYYELSGLNNRLTDRPLAGAGFGLDLVTSYDSVVRLEYSFTSQRTSGLYIHIRKEF
ncbi:MAG: hypothetical protein FJZ78_09875 [Bacteroidetes bacterium]|nr:hypothetical protein [Bacteroidota bacterium]